MKKPAQIEIQAFRLEDLQAIRELFIRTVREVNSQDYTPVEISAWAPEQIDPSLLRKRLLRSFAVVAYQNQKMVGFANLEARGYLDFLYVHAEHQHEGIGAALYQHLETLARNLGLEQLTAEVSVTARPFFERHGFLVESKSENEVRGSRLLNFKMSKELSPNRTRRLAVRNALDYLASDAATRSLNLDPYWPKWDSPWWHVLTLFELGYTKAIPKSILKKLVETLNTHYLHHFPIGVDDLPEGFNLQRHTLCHCALASMVQVLQACSVDVDEELPWIRPWMIRYALPEGGFNCDNDAYLHDPVPSSMVATLPMLEAILHFNPLSVDLRAVLDQGAREIMNRQLRFATDSLHNAEERDDEADWQKLCFPRFYFYDILRGLTFLLRWADQRNQPIKAECVEPVLQILRAKFELMPIKIEREATYPYPSLVFAANQEWIRVPTASRFQLLDQVSGVGRLSPELSCAWNECKTLLAHLQANQLIES